MGILKDILDKHDPAFPLTLEADGMRCTAHGMSRRDYFAAAALTGILSSRMGGLGPEIDSKKAYQYADAMLAAGKVGP